MKRLLVLLLIHFQLFTFAQVSQFGEVRSIVNDQKLNHVLVSAIYNQLQTETDTAGNFYVSTAALTQSLLKFRNEQLVLDQASIHSLYIMLTDVSGRVLLQTKVTASESKIALPSLKSGIYILKVNEGSNTHHYKLFYENNTIEFVEYSEQNYQIDSLKFQKNGFLQTAQLAKSAGVYYLEPIEYQEVDYLSQVPNYTAYSNIESSPRKTNLGEIETIKVVYDFLEDKIYFLQSKKYEIHFLFAKAILGYKQSWQHFNTTQYYSNPERRYYNFVINYHKGLDVYAMEFFGGDEISCQAIVQATNKVKENTYFGDRLFVMNNHPKLDTCLSVALISTEELYKGISYQALSLEKSYGYLTKISVSDLENTYLTKRDLVVLDGVPNDVSVVSGIITSQFQTDLSHINVLSHNRKTPNMALKNAWKNEKINSLLGKLVYLEVQSDSFILREANLDEANAFWLLKEPQTPYILSVDSSDKRLVDFKDIDRQAVNRVGGKAANFSVLYNLGFVPIPENSFAIPVTFYLRHIQNNHIDLTINNIIGDSTFKSNQLYRKEKLKQIQELIKNAPIDTNLINLVSQKINHFANYPSYRFRSSTNAEDLEFFSGAGLYDSFKAEKDNPKKTIEQAIKKVWASAWNFRAFEEREYYKIAHEQVAMGVLVHRAFPEETANGVIVTKNLYNTNPGIIINAQYGEESVVYPKKGVLNDEIMVYYYSVSQETDITIEYLSRSNMLPANQTTVLEYEEIEELAQLCDNLKKHYYYIEKPACNCSYNAFALDIEFKIVLVDGKRKVYIKQVRPYQ